MVGGFTAAPMLRSLSLSPSKNYHELANSELFLDEIKIYEAQYSNCFVLNWSTGRIQNSRAKHGEALGCQYITNVEGSRH